MYQHSHYRGPIRRRERERRLKEIFKEIISENFPNMGKETVKQVQEVQEVYPREDKPKEENSETHRNQTEKIKDKEKYQKQLGKDDK